MAKSGSKHLLMCLLAALIVAMVTGDAAAAPDPDAICNVKISELAECLPAITGKKPPSPTKSCCSVMGKVNLRCLCNYKSELTKYGINPANAMALPGKCGCKLPKECKKKHLR